MTVKYQAYPEYKDSGVEWLEYVPSHWDVKKLKFWANIQPSNIDKKTKEGEVPIALCNYTDVYYNDFIDNSIDFMKASATKEQINKFTLFAGDTIITKDSEDPNDIAVPTFVPADLPGVVCGYHLSMIRPYDISFGAFIKRVFECNYSRSYFATRSNGLTRYGLGTYALENVFFPIPPKKEAVAIANFLDHETAKIDTLIEKQQLLIKLLKEKRQTVISHAVTKGLNSDAPMRDSGVEWLGKVPEHWVISQLKFKTIKMQTGPFGSQLHAEDYVENGIPLINPAHIINDELIPDLNCSVDQETQSRLARHKLCEGDLILARRGELGRCAVVRENQKGWLCGTGSLKATLSKDLIPDYAYMLISSEGVKVELSLESKGSTMDNLNTETLGNIRLPVPTEEEQKEILNYVNKISFKYDQIESRANRQVALLQERRTALISAVVTGKIDVRNWQAPEQNRTSMESTV